jgi:C-terminal processing protease CtpA/Prc
MEPARSTPDDARRAPHDASACAGPEPHAAALHAIRPAAPRAPRAAGFERVARLPGNVGYIDLRAFPGPSRFAAVLGDVMEGLVDASALVLDLRQHRGGSRAAGALLRSWLFDTEPLHVDAVYWSAESRARPARVVPRPIGARFAAAPVYVLIGPESSEVAREVAARLVALGRARMLAEPPTLPPRLA